MEVACCVKCGTVDGDRLGAWPCTNDSILYSTVMREGDKRSYPLLAAASLMPRELSDYWKTADLS